MATPVRIVGVGGAYAGGRSSLATLREALAGAADVGAEVELFDVALMDLPMYKGGSQPIPEEATRFAEAVAGAHGLIWSSPLYHGTVSGAFKNAIDWLELLSKREPAYLTHKVVGLICTAGGTQGLQAINTMEYMVRSLRGWTLPFVVPVANAWQAVDEAGQFVDPNVAVQLRKLGAEVVHGAARLAPPVDAAAVAD